MRMHAESAEKSQPAAGQRPWRWPSGKTGYFFGFHTKIPHFSEIWPNIPIYLIIRNFALRANFDSIPIYLILGVRYTNIPHVFWKFQQYTNIPHAWFGRAKRAYQYTSCFRKMAKYTNIPQFNEYQETITSPLLYRYLPYIICAQCMNNVIRFFLVSTRNCRVKLIEILDLHGGGSLGWWRL